MIRGLPEGTRVYTHDQGTSRGHQRVYQWSGGFQRASEGISMNRGFPEGMIREVWATQTNKFELLNFISSRTVRKPFDWVVKKQRVYLWPVGSQIIYTFRGLPEAITTTTSSHGYYLYEWLDCTLSQVWFDIYTSDPQTLTYVILPTDQLTRYLSNVSISWFLWMPLA